MSLSVLTRKTKIELVSSEQDICELLFAQKRAQHACRLFLDYLKERGGLTRSELSKFVWDLEAGKVEEGFRYRQTSFHRQIRRVLLTLGLIAVEQRFETRQDFDLTSFVVREKYVPVRQPIPKRPPDGLNLPRLMWVICKRWNDEFLDE
ncbi:MAG: hypothetical protein QMD13_03270 [Candidatus Bathyarchaeia archaeon]|nr:hypothetical protein [Candidatus Bathyarchaeia archaeon]